MKMDGKVKLQILQKMWALINLALIALIIPKGNDR